MIIYFLWHRNRNVHFTSPDIDYAFTLITPFIFFSCSCFLSERLISIVCDPRDFLFAFMKIPLKRICFYSPPQPTGAHSRRFMKDFKAGLEPFGTSGWQAVWKLKHIPPLCKLGLAAPMVRMRDHTHSWCGLAVT